MVSVLSILGGGLRPPSEASPRESLRRQSRRSNSVHHVPRGSLLLVSVPGLLGHERRFPTVGPYGARRAAQDVGREQQEQEPLRMGRDDEHRQHHQQQHAGGPAPGKVGSPTNYRRSLTPEYTLNRASLSAPQITKRKAPSQAARPSRPNASV